MVEKIRNIAIIGGGSAGWMTASYLRRALGDAVRITLVESATTKTIGVGEATFSTIRLFFDYLGLEEHEWMPACNAAYKLAIKFVNWNADRRPFYHPFQRYELVRGFPLGDWWLKLQDRDLGAFDQACFVIPALCELKKSPRYLDGTVFDQKVQDHFRPGRGFGKNVLAELKIQYPYAYHFDASRLAVFLCDFAVKLGVSRIIDDVTHVQLTEDGSIAHILTAEHGRICADLFIDCTGFRGLLINQALGEPFIPFADSLLCDSAVALQVPRDIARDGIQPYTTATALSSGWVWNIPLYGRDGTGYVYSSRFLTKEQAEKEFREHLGPAADGLPANHIRMRVGRNRRSWVKNCVAIGLSSGFVEPLESTGIFFIQHGIEELVAHLPSRAMDDALRDSYNRCVGECIDGVREFLTLHYCTSTRADTPFWKATKTDIKVPEPLAERLRLWQGRMPTNRTIYPHYHGFESYSYSVMLLGLGFQGANTPPVLQHMYDDDAIATFRAIRERTEQLCRSLPSQYEYLSAMRQTNGSASSPAIQGVGCPGNTAEAGISQLAALPDGGPNGSA
jgi:tryptophan halogenase